MASVCADSGMANWLTLSVTFSSVSSTDEEYMKSIGISLSGEWRGVIITLYSESEIVRDIA